ncbi:polyprenyl synthetase domain-containing protein [Ditylenchus destructor]|uniref:Farnesyl pyrophosphate synthase n=1 Tax=Ditylenchus destructor TaxID=166010 RepID=A0AAD4NF06_9BILA|nr:polyprenyl synthetase domain-containing protein [Ditylenchus destructor]
MSRKMLLNVIAGLGKEIAADLTKDLSVPQAKHYTAYINRLFDHTMSDGKCARSQLALKTYQTLAPSACTSEESILPVAKVSATLELLQSFFLVIDDVIDHSKMRRGKPCWYTMKDVGLTAIIDGLFLDKAIDYIIERNIPEHPKKYQILKEIFETNRKALVGQRMDCDTTALKEFSWTRYNEIVEHKTSHYSYYLPLIMGFHLADVSLSLPALRPIAYKIGYLFQAQDDYLDCFGDPLVTGKSSNDLAERKCTWITCKLLENLGAHSKSNPDTSHIVKKFDDHFGRPEKEHIDVAKQIIVENGVESEFFTFQNKIATELREDIDRFPLPEIRSVLNNCVNDIMNRKK